MEKYGFVYIWYDCKHKRYYIGSHWGTVDDGYVCSSSWMKNSYKRRPQDFRRRILKKVFSNRKDLLVIENHYLSMIKLDEIKRKYYNLTNKIKDHWTTDDIKFKKVSEKISNSLKGRKLSEEHKEKLKGKIPWNKGLKYEPMTEEEKNIKYRSRIGRTPWNKGIKQGSHKNPRKPYSEEAKNARKGPRGPEAALKAWNTRRNNCCNEVNNL